MIVDAHAHYLSPRVIEELERDAPAYGCELRTTPDGLPQIVFPGRPPLRPVGRPVRDLSERITRIAQQGVDRQVLSTWMELYCYFLPPEIGARWCRLQNRTLAEDLRAAGGRFSGMAVVPLQDGKLAAAELESLWAAAEALDQPVLIHPYAPQIGFRLARYNLSQAVGNPLDTTIAAGCLIFGGVADRHPALKVILAHGGGFFPYQVGRFQRVYQVSPEAREHASRPPLDYARWFYYDTVLLYAPAVRYLVETVGADRVLLGSDYPFDVGDPDPTAVVRAAGLAPAAEAAVLGGTCCQLFGLT